MRAPEHEGIQVNIEERLSKDIVELVQHRIVPLGICWNNADFGGLEYRDYRRDELMLAVPAGHPLADREAVWFADSISYEHIGLESAAAVSSILNKEAAKAGHPLNYRVVVTNFDAAYRVVAAGLGISVIPRQVRTTYDVPRPPHCLDVPLEARRVNRRIHTLVLGAPYPPRHDPKPYFQFRSWSFAQRGFLPAFS